jgi:hypothetical protein
VDGGGGRDVAGQISLRQIFVIELIYLRHGKHQPTGQNLGRVFNFRNGHLQAEHLLCYRVKLLNLKLKTWHKQLLSYLPLDIVLPSKVIEESAFLVKNANPL